MQAIRVIFVAPYHGMEQEIAMAFSQFGRPEVEYIDIPSDSVTLSAPAGAVDYEQFHERNPYGFADCVGARYLMFPVVERPAYSYTTPRARDKRTP